MKKIHKYIDAIHDEMCGAMTYAEKYIIYKTSKPQWSRMYGEMSLAELTHATNLSTMGKEFIDELTYVPEEDKECWEKCMAKMIEKTAMVRLLLSK